MKNKSYIDNAIHVFIEGAGASLVDSLYWNAEEIYEKFLVQNDDTDDYLEWDESLILILLEGALDKQFYSVKRIFDERYPKGSTRDEMIIAWLCWTDHLSNVKSEEIATYAGMDDELDMKIAQLPLDKFMGVLKALTKIIDKCELDIEKVYKDIPKTKSMTSRVDRFFANVLSKELTIHALRHGLFKNSKDRNSLHKRAKRGRKDLLEYLTLIGSPYTKIVNKISVDLPNDTSMTLDTFLDSHRESVSNSIKIKDIHRFNSFFALVKKLAKKSYLNIIADNHRRLEEGKPLIPLEKQAESLITLIKKDREEYLKPIHYMRTRIDKVENAASDIILGLMMMHTAYHSE